MTTYCERSASGTIELYFYGDLAPADHLEIQRHVEGCATCQAVLADLATIRSALASVPVVDAPPGEDWSGFMRRLTDATDREGPAHDRHGTMRAAPAAGTAVAHLPWRPRHISRPTGPGRWARSGAIATAAVLALVVAGVSLAMRSTRPAAPPLVAEAPASQAATPAGDADGFEALSEEHLQRSKLVVLGLATKDPSQVTSADWTYERDLAATLLTDTRMYRMAAEDRGLGPIADVMRDLELVLLQTSFTDAGDPASLAEIQRLIRKRDLVGKMDVVGMSGL